MKYISLGDGKWVEVNEETNASRVIIESEVEASIKEIDNYTKDKLVFSDAQKILWFDQNYPNSEENKEIEEMLKEKTKLEELLTMLE